MTTSLKEEETKKQSERSHLDQSLLNTDWLIQTAEAPAIY